MTLLLIEVAVIVAGIAAVPQVKRAGDESWRRHQTMRVAAPIREAFVRLQITLADQLTPTLRQMGAVAAEFGQRYGELTGTDPVTRELVRLTLGGRPERPELIPTEETR